MIWTISLSAGFLGVMSSNKPIRKTGMLNIAAVVNDEGLLGSVIPRYSAIRKLNPKETRIQNPPDNAISPLCCFLTPSGLSTIPKYLNKKGPIANTTAESINTKK